MNQRCTCANAGTCAICRIRQEARGSGKTENQAAREMADKAVEQARLMREYFAKPQTKV